MSVTVDVAVVFWVVTSRVLTLILLTWRIWWAPNNASKWQTGFNSMFKGLIGGWLSAFQRYLLPPFSTSTLKISTGFIWTNGNSLPDFTVSERTSPQSYYTVPSWFHKNNQLDASIYKIYFCHKTLHVSVIFCAHHQGLSTVHTANGTFHAGYVTAG